MSEKRYYWLKLKRDFFKRHDIRIIEAMPNGKDYVLFYLKLLLESIDHEGTLRFSETIPYNEEMLSIITNTNIDIVRSAMKLFSELKMVEILEDSTIYMAEVDRLIGSAADNDNANRQRRFRERKKIEALPVCYSAVTKDNESKSKEKELESDKEKEDIGMPPAPPVSPKPTPKAPERHKHGANGWVLLTDDQYSRLLNDFGPTELKRCIDYVDESAAISKNRNEWKDWNLVIRKCHREQWYVRPVKQGRKDTGFQTSNPFMEMLHEERGK